MQAEAQQQEIEETTSVELEDDSTEEVVENSEETKLSEDETTRTNVQDDDDELDQYSENVQKRIKKLTAARRKAEEEAAAAVQYIQQVQSENENIKQRLKTIDKGYVSEYEGRITSQEAQAKRALAEAHEAGDYEKVADAQSAIAQIAIEKERLRLQKARSEQDQEQAEVPQQAQPQAQPQPQQERDPKLEAWLSKNTWFGKDSIMTGAARALHETLVAEEGFDPRTDEYYAEIDKRMRREMPNKFQGDKKNVQSVTPAGSGTRSLKSGRKKSVELNPGQVALAQKLNIPLEKYAAEVAKLENRRD
jgi:chromosome segregation ATPase